MALLASATPSLESFHHARTGKYKLLRLDARIENRPMARVEIVDLREDFRQTHRAGPISERLRSELAARLAAGTQSLVLINRRGYSWFALCRSCGASILCENCSIALTYHKRDDRLLCHYCGFSRRVPKACPKCGSEYVYFVGAGAEQLEERLRALFPEARIARLDRDTARSKRAFEQVLGAFAAGRIDILVGTQMVAKGHDFQRVTLVGVVSADAQLGFPDFRAAERTFQLLTQVAGRAGRGDARRGSPGRDALSRALRDPACGAAGLPVVFREGVALPPAACTIRRSARWRVCWCATRSWSRPSAGRARSARFSSRWSRAASRCWARRRRRWRASSANTASNFC